MLTSLSRLLALGFGLAIGLLGSAAVSLADEPPASPAGSATDTAPAAPAAPVVAKPRFLRLTRNDQGEAIALETAVARYVPRGPNDPAPAPLPAPASDLPKSDDQKPADAAPAPEPFTPPADLVVDLFGAVHIGEASYYEQINRDFKDYEVVLYELVAPPGTRIPRGGAQSAHPVAMMQGGMKSMLGLESQTELVDYQADNLVHADMSPEQLEASMAERGDGFIALFFRMMGQSIAQQSREQVLRASGVKLPKRASQTDMLAALLNPGRNSGGLKQMLAEQFENMEATMLALEGPKGSSLISERNKVALAGLREQVKLGKRRIAIFYGAGHLPDLERRLLTEYGLKRDSERWLLAWDLKSVPQPAKRRPAAPAPVEEDADTEKPAAEPVKAPGN
jgi:hypothetical protein